eukprot:13896433-Ditylum_brightwellii.AAC.1
MLELKAVIWNETNAEYIIANKEKKKVFFWATLGGGGGLSVITDIKMEIMQSLELLPGEDNFTQLKVSVMEQDNVKTGTTFM